MMKFSIFCLDSCDNNYSATANVLYTAQLQDTQHETTENVDCLNSDNESCIDDKIASKELLLFEHSYAGGNKNEDSIDAAPIVDESERKGSKSKAYQYLGKRCKDLVMIVRENDHCEFAVRNETSPRYERTLLTFLHFFSFIQSSNKKVLRKLV